MGGAPLVSCPCPCLRTNPNSLSCTVRLSGLIVASPACRAISCTERSLANDLGCNLQGTQTRHTPNTLRSLSQRSQQNMPPPSLTKWHSLPTARRQGNTWQHK